MGRDLLLMMGSLRRLRGRRNEGRKEGTFTDHEIRATLMEYPKSETKTIKKPFPKVTLLYHAGRLGMEAERVDTIASRGQETMQETYAFSNRIQ